jgi:hypothetical protein
MAANTVPDDSFFKPNPIIHVIKLNKEIYLSENGDHRAYFFAQKGLSEYSQTMIYDTDFEDDRLELAKYRRERRRRKQQIDMFSSNGQKFWNELNPEAQAIDIRIQDLSKIVEFVRSNGIYQPLDLEGKFFRNKHEIDKNYNLQFVQYLNSVDNKK